MKRIIFGIFLLVSTLSAIGQIWDGDRISTQKLSIRGKRIDSIKTNIQNIAGDDRSIMTSGAVYQLITAEGGIKFKIQAVAPTDTLAAWVDTSISILQCSPVRLWANGKWTDTNAASGLFFDRVGNVLSNGAPYKIIVSGQSNPFGPYMPTPATTSPYNGYYGDTLPDPHVVGWNDTLSRWEVAHIGSGPGTPWYYSSGANYVMLLGKHIARNQGRSVRIVADGRGGTPLDAWAGAIGGIPDTAVQYIRLGGAITRSKIKHPDLFIWGHGEAGLTNNGSGGVYYYNKLLQFYDSLRSDKYIDTTTVILTTGIGDPTFGTSNLASTLQSEGGLRATLYDDDVYTGYVGVSGVQTDGIHFTPKGHEEIARRLYSALKDYPLDRLRNPLGYGSIAPLSGINGPRSLIVDGLQYSGGNGNPYIKFGVTNNALTIGDPLTSTSGNLSKLDFNSNTNRVGLYGYDGGKLEWSPSGWTASTPFASSTYSRVQSGGAPYVELYNVVGPSYWRMSYVYPSNFLAFGYNGSNLVYINSLGSILFGGMTASFPSLKRNGIEIQVLKADGSAPADISAANASFSKVKITSIPEYTDNTNALANGLVAGDVYRTGDTLKIVH